tara:strand:- start:3520 stop:3933 length:414 start_codon:yes stop_codon:yes gene_type:complete
MNNPIIFPKAKIWLDDGILFWKILNDDIEFVLSDIPIQIYIEAMRKLTGDQACPLIIDARDVKGTYSIEAAKLFANSPIIKEVRLSEAFVTNSINSRLLIASYVRIFDSQTPFLIVDSLEEAITYSHEIKRANNASN